MLIYYYQNEILFTLLSNHQQYSVSLPPGAACFTSRSIYPLRLANKRAMSLPVGIETEYRQHVSVSGNTSCDPRRTNKRGGMTVNYALGGTCVCRSRFSQLKGV